MSETEVPRLLELFDTQGPLSLHGLTGSSRALLLARLARKKFDRILVVCPDEDRADTLASDIEAIGALDAHEPIRTEFIPSWEQSPYSAAALSIRTRIARVRALGSLADPQWKGVMTLPIEAALQRTIPPELFAQFSIELITEESVGSREELLARLLELGYLQTDPVEDPGTLGVRGEIIDLFPLTRSRPVRIELFGDLIERIREYDPETQRAIPDSLLKTVKITPAREVLLSGETQNRLREKIKEDADDRGISRSIRDPIIASIQTRSYLDHSEAWAEYAYEGIATILDHFFIHDSGKTALIWDDFAESQTELKKWLENEERRYSSSAESGLILPPPKKLIQADEDFLKTAMVRAQLHLNTLADAHPNIREIKTYLVPELFPVGSSKRIEDMAGHIDRQRKEGFQVALFASTKSQLDRIHFLLEEQRIGSVQGPPAVAGEVRLFQGSLSSGFAWPSEGLVVITEEEFLGTKGKRSARSSRKRVGGSAESWSGLQALSDLMAGDLIVHVDHGIGRYLGLVRLDLLGAPSDYIQLEYAGKDKLYLPVYRLGVIQKYLGGGGSTALDKLGSQQFEKTKAKVRDAVRKLAFDLVDLYARRKLQQGYAFPPRDADFQEFESRFAFAETPDQLKAIDATISDLESGRVMDRLVCGDVGYGKTEVAIRAAYLAASRGKQVAVLVPTTVLCHQHEESFKSRLQGTPIVINSVSRFKSAKEQKAAIADLKEGKIDIIVGTHRLLSKDVQFKDLGLVIVDEEHRFGVEHKEKLKALKLNTHVLTLTATPIPRTLHMSLSGLRDISLITTPPIDRLPIRTFVSSFDDDLITQAIKTELSRGGQVFFVHNRVHSIYEVASKVRELVPEAKIAVGHGQMAEGELEKTMISFYQKQTNVLVCTTIVESGLDLPSANTIIIDGAENLGLAQLYQLRGRVGRSQLRAYAYLLVSSKGELTDTAKKRLEAIQRFVELGSGFSIASHDLEIRGGGNLLGAEQSGHVASVGFDLYTELLEEAIQEIQGQAAPETSNKEPEIKAPFAAFLSEEYIPDIHQRLSLYRRLSVAKNENELLSLEEEIQDRYGKPPVEATHLIWLIRLKILLRDYGVDVLVVGNGKVSLLPSAPTQLDPAKALRKMAREPKRFSLLPDSKMVLQTPTPEIQPLFFALESLFKELT